MRPQDKTDTSKFETHETMEKKVLTLFSDIGPAMNHGDMGKYISGD